jgi:hypothetical protein
MSANTQRHFWMADFSTRGLGFSDRARTVMYHFCCEDVFEMDALSDDDILSLRGVGRKTLEEIRWVLAEHRLEHTDAQREQWLAELAFKREFETALAKFMHKWLDSAPEAASSQFNCYRWDLREIDEAAAQARLTLEEKMAARDEDVRRHEERLAQMAAGEYVPDAW